MDHLEEDYFGKNTEGMVLPKDLNAVKNKCQFKIG